MIGIRYSALLKRPEATLPDNIVPHPRYGAVPRISTYTPNLWDRGWDRYVTRQIFPHTALPLDLGKRAWVPLQLTEFYLDVLETCIDCQRPFLFFAEEQKYWIEELQFSFESWAVRCVECRREEQTLKLRFARYSETVNRDDLNDNELGCLADDVVFLWGHGLIMDPQKMGRIKNLAKKRIPEHPAIEMIDRAIRS